MGFLGQPEPIVLQLYSETLQKFRLAAQGHGALQPPERASRARGDVLRSAADLVRAVRRRADRRRRRAASRSARSPSGRCSCTTPGVRRTPGCGRSPRATGCTCIPDTGARYGIADEDWIDGRPRTTARSPCRRSSPPTCSPTRCGPGTRSASAAAPGAWRKDAPEGREGFLLNHLISDITPRGDYANADPVTGQAAWFDLRVRIAKADAAARERAAVRAARAGPGRRPTAALRRPVPQEAATMKACAPASPAGCASCSASR